jgi:flagella basal body P-ring formation protein FlgA
MKGQGREIVDPSSIGPLDARMSLPACDKLEITARGASSNTYQLRCEAPTPWTHVVRAGIVTSHVAVKASEASPSGQWTIIVPKMDLPAGTVLTAEVLEERQVNNAPASFALKSMNDAVGLRLASASGPGVALTTRSVVRAFLVSKGENVTLVAGGNGFEISAPGRSEQDGYEGDLISVKNLKTGAIVKGRLERGKIVSVMKL